MAPVRARARFCRCAGIFRRRSSNRLAILKVFSKSFLLAFGKVLVVEPVRERNEFVIPAVLTRIVTADEQHRSATRIKRVHDPERATTMLDAKLAEASMPRALDPRAMWKRQIRSELLEQSDRVRNLPDHNLHGI
jgi:hypothetical protein